MKEKEETFVKWRRKRKRRGKVDRKKKEGECEKTHVRKINDTKLIFICLLRQLEPITF